jgi:hypothetical protein
VVAGDEAVPGMVQVSVTADEEDAKRRLSEKRVDSIYQPPTLLRNAFGFSKWTITTTILTHIVLLLCCWLCFLVTVILHYGLSREQQQQGH